MPIFDFVCSPCDYEFETLILGENDLVQCPHCGSDSVNRITVSLFSCTGVQLTKRLTMDSEERMKRGKERMKGREIRKDRIKIL